MATICYELPPLSGDQCIQKAKMNVSDGLRCRAIDKAGYNVDGSFKISYTIL